jgi:hypothetical protein
VKKRKINIKRLLILTASVLVVIALLVTGLTAAINYSIQRTRHAKVEEILEERNAFIDQIDKLQNTGNISDSSYESLRTLAKSENASAYAMLESLTDKTIDAETYEEVLKIDPLADGAGFKKVLENSYQIPEDYITFLLKDDDRLDFVLAYLDQDQYQSAPETLSEDLSKIPHLLQWDLRWGYMPYGDSIVAFAGCGPTCLSMVYSYLNQDASITPYYMAKYAMDNDYYAYGSGTYHSFMYESAEAFDINVEGISVDAQTISSALAQGKILIASMNPGDFTTTGHFIVLYGINGNSVKVLDPNSIKNTEKEWDINTLVDQMAAIWCYTKDDVQTQE